MRRISLCFLLLVAGLAAACSADDAGDAGSDTAGSHGHGQDAGGDHAHGDAAGHGDDGAHGHGDAATHADGFDPHAPENVFLGCGDPESLDVYAPGMSKESAGGLFTVTLESAEPAPPDRGKNSWVVVLKDAAGDFVEGASVVAEPTMPTHGHGTAPRFTEATPMQPPATYHLHEMDLFMPGLWKVDIFITGPDGGEEPDDAVVFNFCIQG